MDQDLLLESAFVEYLGQSMVVFVVLLELGEGFGEKPLEIQLFSVFFCEQWLSLGFLLVKDIWSHG